MEMDARSEYLEAMPSSRSLLEVEGRNGNAEGGHGRLDFIFWIHWTLACYYRSINS